jgi:hypothetical protein
MEDLSSHTLIFYTSHSQITKPGPDATAAIDALPSSLPALRHASSQLMFHYRAGDFTKSRVPLSRLPEIQTRLAAPMLTRVLSRSDAGPKDTLLRDREPIDRTVGCCRDAAVLFLSMARHKGIPCRTRVGWASYLMEGWWMDHVVVEVWDRSEKRWRLVDAQMRESYQPKIGDVTVDWLDLRHGIDFRTGPFAWREAREGRAEVGRYVVSPGLGKERPELEGWPYLAHNVVLDLAAVNKREMLLWDSWGMLERFLGGSVSDEDAKMLDEVVDAVLGAEYDVSTLAEVGSKHGLAVTPTVRRLDPMGGPPVVEDLGDILNGVKTQWHA